MVITMIEVTVFASALDFRNNKRALCKRVDWIESIQFPFEHLIKAFKALYGDKCIIVFNIQ